MLWQDRSSYRHKKIVIDRDLHIIVTNGKVLVIKILKREEPGDPHSMHPCFASWSRVAPPPPPPAPPSAALGVLLFLLLLLLLPIMTNGRS